MFTALFVKPEGLAVDSMSVSPKTYVSARHVRLKDDYLARVFRGEEFLLFDGAMGTQLQAHGLKAGALPELLCITDPQVVTSIHSLYEIGRASCRERV